MRILLLILCVAVLLGGCASKSRFEGDSIEAYDAREDFSNNVFGAWAPNTCRYSLDKRRYECDDPKVELVINKRVVHTRKRITDHLYDDPWIKHYEEIGFITLEDLYYCRDAEGNRPDRAAMEMTIYCETPFSPFVLKEFLGKNPDTKTTPAGKHNDLYKYALSWK